MRLPSYASACNFDLLRIEQLAALAPNLLGRMPEEELVGIGVTENGSGAGLAAWPLADLADGGEGPERFCAVFTRLRLERVVLIAFTATPASVVVLADPIRNRLVESGRYEAGFTAAVTPDGNWCDLEHGSGRAAGTAAAPLPRLDPVVARAWTLTFRVGRHLAELATTVATGSGEYGPGARERAQAVQTWDDLAVHERHQWGRELLQAALDGTASRHLRHTTALGLALADDPELLAAAIDAAWDGADTTGGHLEVWEAAARAGTGRAAATCAMLAALAAWRTGQGDLAIAWRDLAVAADPDCAFVRWIADLPNAGIPAAALQAAGPLHPSGLAAIGSQAPR